MFAAQSSDDSACAGQKTSALLRVYQGETLERPPIWFMRQAGRYLPEYRALRAHHSMLELIRTPKLAAEVTLQPLRRFDFDGSIIFADILNPLIGMGAHLEFVEGDGPIIRNPVRTFDDVMRLEVPPTEANVAYTLEAIALVAAELSPRGIPLLGFAGAPFTLSCYLIEGRGDQALRQTKQFMLSEPDAWALLQDKLSELIVNYLCSQVRAGAAAVQLFDSWTGQLGPAEFERFALPWLSRIVAEYKKRSAAPIVFFSTGSSGLFNQIKTIGADVISIDWRSSLLEARKIFGPAVPLQGNLDPAILCGPIGYLEDQVRRILDESRKIGAHIFNLGHGILPHTPIENVARTVALVREFSDHR